MKPLEKLGGTYSDSVIERQHEKTLLKMDWGNYLVLDKDRQEIKVIDKNNATQLIIKIRPEGLSLQINAVDININAVNQLNFYGKEVNIEASDAIRIKTHGDLVHEIGNNSTSTIGGTNNIKAQTQLITAELGNVEIKANDDVRLDGERVLFNCD
jgi:hypothetical protein